MIVVTGPTGSGKSDLAVDLAERFGGEIVGADSRQVYRRLEIGTAKPGPDPRRRVPHHLIDVLDPAESFDLATYQRLVQEAFEGIWARGRLPFLVGGTLQYVRAILAGWVPPAVPPDPALRDRLLDRIDHEGVGVLYAELLRLDPGAAGIVRPDNPRRIVRALEVCLLSGRPFSTQRATRAPDFDNLVIALTLDRVALYARVDRRAQAMFEQGLIAEVAALLEAGYDASAPAFTSIGYREVVGHLRGDLSASEALDRLQFGTHRYIRQQYAWLRREAGVHWIDTGDPAAARAAATGLIDTFLGSRRAE